MQSDEAVRVIWAVVALVASFGGVTLVWKIAWTLRGYTESQERRAKTEEEVAQAVTAFVEVQRETNVVIRQAQESTRDQLNQLMAVSSELHQAVRSVNRKVQALGEPGDGQEATAQTV